MGVSCGQARQHLLSAKGRGRTATATPFCPRRATKDHEERQRQHLLSAKGREERQRQHLLSTKGHERHARTATATSFCPRRARRATKNGNGNTLLSTKGHEGPRRTATATPFVHEGARRAAKNGNCNFLLSTKLPLGGEEELPFDPRSAKREWPGVRRERTLGPSPGGAGTVAEVVALFGGMTCDDGDAPVAGACFWRGPLRGLLFRTRSRAEGPTALSHCLRSWARPAPPEPG